MIMASNHGTPNVGRRASCISQFAEWTSALASLKHRHLAEDDLKHGPHHASSAASRSRRHGGCRSIVRARVANAPIDEIRRQARTSQEQHTPKSRNLWSCLGAIYGESSLTASGEVYDVPRIPNFIALAEYCGVEDQMLFRSPALSNVILTDILL